MQEVDLARKSIYKREMKRVFIYGDSNVWGENFAGSRIPYHQRWVNRLRQSLKSDFEIVSSGVCGRVAGNYRFDKPERNGQSEFLEIYEQSKPVDIVMIALGTNDLQEKFHRSVNDIINDLLWYKDAIKGAKITYLLPPNFNDTEESGPEFTAKSKQLRDQIIENQKKFTNSIIVNDIELSDGVHFSAQGHRLMAKIISENLRRTI